MKVYVLTWLAYEDTWPMGAYSSLERAKEAAQKAAGKSPITWEGPDRDLPLGLGDYWHGYTKGADSQNYAVVEFELDE